MDSYVESKKVYLVEISNRIEVTRGRTIRKGGEEVGQQINIALGINHVYLISQKRGV